MGDMGDMGDMGYMGYIGYMELLSVHPKLVYLDWYLEASSLCQYPTGLLHFPTSYPTPSDLHIFTHHLVGFQMPQSCSTRLAALTQGNLNISQKPPPTL